MLQADEEGSWEVDKGCRQVRATILLTRYKKKMMKGCVPKERNGKQDPLRLSEGGQEPVAKLGTTPSSDEMIVSKHNEIIVEHMRRNLKPVEKTMIRKELKQHLDQIFNKYDHNQNGILEMEEIESMLNHIYQLRRGSKARLDREHINDLLGAKDYDGDTTLTNGSSMIYTRPTDGISRTTPRTGLQPARLQQFSSRLRVQQVQMVVNYPGEERMGKCLVSSADTSHESRSPGLRKIKESRTRQSILNGEGDDSTAARNHERIEKKMRREKPAMQSEVDMRRLLEDIFDKYDRDQDGKLDLTELTSMLNHISRRKHKVAQFFTAGEVKIILGKADTSGDVASKKMSSMIFIRSLTALGAQGQPSYRPLRSANGRRARSSGTKEQRLPGKGNPVRAL